MHSNQLTSQVRLVDNVRRIGRRLKRDEKMAKSLNEMMAIMYRRVHCFDAKRE